MAPAAPGIPLALKGTKEKQGQQNGTIQGQGQFDALDLEVLPKKMQGEAGLGVEREVTVFCKAENCLCLKETPESAKGTQEDGSVVKTELIQSSKALQS